MSKDVKSLIIEAISSHPRLVALDIDQKLLSEELNNSLTSALIPAANKSNLYMGCFNLCTLIGYEKKDKVGMSEFVKDVSLHVLKTIPDVVSKIDAMGISLHFFIKTDYLANLLIDKVLNQSYFEDTKDNDEKQTVMIEMGQPNFMKFCHVGHVRNIALGDCMVRVNRQVGNKVVAANYYGDEGAHIAVTLYEIHRQAILQTSMNALLNLVKCENPTLLARATWMNTQYCNGKRQLDLSTLTKYPYPGVILGKVVKIGDESKADSVTLGVQIHPDGTTLYCASSSKAINLLHRYVAVAKKGSKIGKVTCNKDMIFTKKMADEKSTCIDPVDYTEEVESFFKFIGVTTDGVDDSIYGLLLTELGSKLSLGKSVDKEYKIRQEKVDYILKQLEDSKTDNEFYKAWKRCGKWSKDYFEDIFTTLDTRFDREYYESEESKPSLLLMDKFKKLGKLHERNNSYGVDFQTLRDAEPDKKTREVLGTVGSYFMLIKSNGSGLYGTKDISLAIKKFEEFNLDQSIYVVASEQDLHFKQVFASLQHLGYGEYARKSSFIIWYGTIGIGQDEVS